MAVNRMSGYFAANKFASQVAPRGTRTAVVPPGFTSLPMEVSQRMSVEQQAAVGCLYRLAYETARRDLQQKFAPMSSARWN